MFHLFGNKKEKPTPQAQTPAPQAQEQPPVDEGQEKAWAAQFLPREVTLLAVTGPTGFGRRTDPATGHVEAGIELTAWMEEDGDELVQGSAQLLAPLRADLLAYLQSHVPRDFIIKVQARPSESGDRFLMADLPVPGFDPDLKAILDKQTAPVTIETEDLGDFTLNRTAGWFQAEADWPGGSILLNFEQQEDADACLATARALMEDPQGWDGRLRQFATGQLLPQAQQWAQEGEEDEVTAQTLEELLLPDSVVLHEDGRLVFWYGDGGLLWGRSIQVQATLSAGPQQLQVMDA